MYSLHLMKSSEVRKAGDPSIYLPFIGLVVQLKLIFFFARAAIGYLNLPLSH